MKQRAKKVNSQAKYPATGGGPKPPSPSPIDETMMSLLAGKPSLEGIEGGFETSGQIISDSEILASSTGITMTSEPGTSAGVAVTSPKLQKKRKHVYVNDVHTDVLLIEKEKIKLEMEYIQLKMKKVTSEMELLEMKKNSLSTHCFSLSQLTEM